ncbi:hypothetical protein OTU49_013355, partial [Cherax quadricarinatus]
DNSDVLEVTSVSCWHNVTSSSSALTLPLASSKTIMAHHLPPHMMGHSEGANHRRITTLKDSLAATRCRTSLSKIIFEPFVGKVIAGFIVFLIISSVEGAEGSHYNAAWLSGGSVKAHRGSSGVTVVRREAPESQVKSGEDDDNSAPKPSRSMSAAPTVKEIQGTTGGEETEEVTTQNHESADGQDQVSEKNMANRSDAGKSDAESIDEHKLMGDLKGISPEAVLRGFYVFVGVGTIVLLYILVKLLRLRRRRATRKYRVLSHSDDQEMFPLAADDGDDEEIYNAADHQTLK